MSDTDATPSTTKKQNGGNSKGTTTISADTVEYGGESYSCPDGQVTTTITADGKMTPPTCPSGDPPKKTEPSGKKSSGNPDAGYSPPKGSSGNPDAGGVQGDSADAGGLGPRKGGGTIDPRTGNVRERK